MPGIFGFAAQSMPVDRSELLAEMERRLTHHAWYKREPRLYDDGNVGLGRVSLAAVQTEPQPAQNENGSIAAVLDGELYGVGRVRAELERAGHQFSSDSHAELLIHGYELEGRNFLRRIDGKFAAAIWDSRARWLLLVNDRFGMKPLYYAHVPGRLLWGSEIKALLADPDVPRGENRRGLAQFFTFGHLLSGETLHEAVRLVRPGGCVTYDLADDRLRVDSYWRLGELAGEHFQDEAHWLECIDDALEQAVSRQVDEGGRLGLALSGGLDARTVLALVDCKRTRLQTVSLGMEGSLDHRSAARLASLAGSEHHSYLLNDGFLSKFEEHLRTMVHLTDGHYIDQCIVLPTLPLYRELGIEVLLRGHAGELMHMDKAYNFSLDRAAWAVRSEADLEGWLFRHLCAYMLDGVDGPLFASSSAAEVEALARDSLRECLAESAGVERQLQRIWHLFVSQRLPRETAPSLAMFGSVVETRVPLLDLNLVELLLAAPPELKVGDRIQTHILRRRRPEFLAIVNANTGTKMGTSALRRRAATFQLRVLAKLGVKGYQPYERLGLWLRRELRDLVGSLLLSDRCLERRVFHPDTVRRVVRQQQDAGRNHTYLLMAMMIYELGQREFIDGDASSFDAARAAPVGSRA